MSTPDNWIKFNRWWQENLKSHFISTSIINNHGKLRRRPSLIPLRITTKSPFTKIKKHASYGGFDEVQYIYNGCRHVRDHTHSTTLSRSSLSAKKNIRDHQSNESKSCELGSEDIHLSKTTSMSKTRNINSRRSSLIKIDLLSEDAYGSKDEQKSTFPSSSPNLIQKLLFRQFNPKTRPYVIGIAADDSVPTAKSNNSTPTMNNNRRLTNTMIAKPSWANSPNLNSPKTMTDGSEENLSLLTSNTTLTKNTHSDLQIYLSKRRNTTGSISLNKVVDLKINASGNTSKLSTIPANSYNANNKISTENIFQAVEDSDRSATKQLIETNRNAINSLNEYDWCPLDIAIMLNDTSMIELLLVYGAEESSKIQFEEDRYKNLCQQLTNLNEIITDESNKKSSSSKLSPDDNQANRSSPSNDKQQRHRRFSKNQQHHINEQRYKMLSQMKDNYEKAGVPDAPTNVRLMVTGSDNITVTFDEPLRSNGAMVTKYKIEWSIDEDFNNLSLDIIKNCFLREFVIRNLPIGQKCYVRVSAGNMKGFGQSIMGNPPYCVPSNWREFSKKSRTNIYDLCFEDILNKILNEKDSNGMNRQNDIYVEQCDTTTVKNRRRSYGNIRRNLRQLFQLYPRLAKTMKRGLYLVSVILNGDRILVTNDDVLPMIEVDENYGHSLLLDFQWFMKLTFVWDDLKSLRPDLERCSSATSFYLRLKLVQAAIELQTLEEINNLGRLNYTYIRDNDGNVAFVLINDLTSDTRTTISPSNFKWITMTKFYETMKESNLFRTSSCFQQIIEKLPDMIDFYHASMRRLDSGLYVAYLKMQNSVDSIRVMVNKSMPGSLPCVKIRPIANVSREEWEWLHKNNENLNDDESSDDSLDQFKIQFRTAAKNLFSLLDVPETHFSNSRIYDSQVVEIRDDLSLIILMSTADEVNALSTSLNHSLASFIYLPIYVFEVLQHLSNNYRFICQYSRISICLDFELIYAQQNQREAFSTCELDETRCRLNHLLSCQQDLDDIWRLSRWLVHVISCAKDKTYSGIPLKSLQSSPTTNDSYLMEKNNNCFIDIENHFIEITFYLFLLKTKQSRAIKLRVNKATKLNEILQIIFKQEQIDISRTNSLFHAIWKNANGNEEIIEENLTAFDIHQRLLHFGGQINIHEIFLSPSSSSLFSYKAETNSIISSESNSTLNIH